MTTVDPSEPIAEAAAEGVDRNVGRTVRFDRDHPRYKWIVLSNTTLGMLLATINASIVLISLPAIFSGIELEPAGAGQRQLPALDAHGLPARVRGAGGHARPARRHVRPGQDVQPRLRRLHRCPSIALSLDPFTQGGGALWLIVWRVVQAVGGAMLFANSTAILTDAFPARQRGMALGINQVAAIAGSFIGLVLGGVLAEWDWRSVFWVSVPIGVVGTIWSYRSLHELGTRRAGRIDWWGNVTFAVGLSVLLAGITYGIQPYGGHSTGWTNPWVLAGLIGGVVLLVVFCVVETQGRRTRCSTSACSRTATFAGGNLAGLLASIGRGGLQFMLIIWLQGIWLPLHGYSYADTPLWAGIYLLPLTVGFLVAGPLSGYLSDRYGHRWFAVGGLVHRRGDVRRAAAAAGRLPVLVVRAADHDQRHRLRPVLPRRTRRPS